MNAPLVRHQVRDVSTIERAGSGEPGKGRGSGHDRVPGNLDPTTIDPKTLCRLLEGQQAVMRFMSGRGDLGETLSAVAAVANFAATGWRCAVAHCMDDATGVAIVDASGKHASVPVSAMTEFIEAAAGASWIAHPGAHQLGAAAAELVEASAEHGVWCEVIRQQLESETSILLVFQVGEQQNAVPGATEIRRALADMVRCTIEAKHREIVHEDANQRFMALAKTVPGVIYQRVVRSDGDIRYTYISESARDLFGVEPNEIIAEPQALFGRHGPEYAASFRERLLKASREMSVWDVEATIITRAGEKKHTHAIARPYRAPDGSVVWNGVILDQTRIKEAELAAQQAETRTRETITESIPQGLALFDPDGRLVTCNAIYLELYPFLRDQVARGTTYDEILRAETEHGLDVDSEDSEAGVASRIEAVAAGGNVFERRLPTGEWILVNERRAEDGATVVLHTVVTELKEREAALQRSNRELQDFAFVASHDLQEPLRKIEAFGGRLANSLADQLDERSKLYLDRMLNAAERMRILIGDLLAYSRVTTKAQPFMVVSLERIVSDVIGDLQVTIEETHADIKVDPLPTIDADPTQMRMLFQNLLSNALKYRKDDSPPSISVTVDNESVSADGTKQVPYGAAAVTVRVKDNGIGFDMKYADRIFAIFQRLHGRNDYEGTGIGLATCRKIVERHGGQIAVDSEVGHGSDFIVTLPLKQAYVETIQ